MHCGGSLTVLGKARKLLDGAGVLLGDLHLIRAAERVEGAVDTLAGAVGASPLLAVAEDLRARIEEVGVLWEFSVGLPGDFAVAWNYNQYGTSLQHVTFGYRWKPGGSRAPAPKSD